MLKLIGNRWFLELTKTSGGTVRIAVDQIAVLNDDGATCGVVTASGFIAAVRVTADEVWALMMKAVPTGGQLND